jgi:hypothetical protein
MAELFPSFARKREAINHAVFTKALSALRKSVQGYSDEERERFQCLAADVARILAWAAGRRDWLSLLEVATRGRQEEFSIAVRKMGLAESLETALWAAMRSHPRGLFRNALALVAIRLHLGTAWVHGEVLHARDTAGAMILDAFDVAELSPSKPADLTAEDFRIGTSTVGGDIFAKLADDVFSRAMDPGTVLTERGAPAKPLRDAFDIDPPGLGGRAGSPCYDLPLRFNNETGVKGAFSSAAKVFDEDAAGQALARLGTSVAEVKKLVLQHQVMAIAGEIWGARLQREAAALIGADVAAELQRRCHMALAYGRAVCPAFILMAMVAESRWLTLAGEGGGETPSALSTYFEAGGSWPSVVPPQGISVRAADQNAEPTESQVLTRNQWTGREFKWYWVAGIIALMVYGWAVSIGLL